MKFVYYLSPKDIVVKFFEDGYTNQNYDYIMNCVAENYIDNSPVAARSNADAVGILKIVAGQFSNLTVKVLDVFDENNMVATRILYDGIHTGTCTGPGMPIVNCRKILFVIHKQISYHYFIVQKYERRRT